MRVAGKPEVQRQSRDVLAPRQIDERAVQSQSRLVAIQWHAIALHESLREIGTRHPDGARYLVERQGFAAARVQVLLGPVNNAKRWGSKHSPSVGQRFAQQGDCQLVAFERVASCRTQVHQAMEQDLRARGCCSGYIFEAGMLRGDPLPAQLLQHEQARRDDDAGMPDAGDQMTFRVVFFRADEEYAVGIQQRGFGSDPPVDSALIREQDLVLR